jgi:ATP-dependent Clp protease ATP-binding subunit ClpB
MKILQITSLLVMILTTDRLAGEADVFNVEKENDSASTERLINLDKELGAMQEQIRQRKAHWQNEKDLIQIIRKINEELEQLGVEE